MYVVLSPDESALLRRITEGRPRADSGGRTAPSRRRTGAIKLAPTEMDLVRRLGGMAAARGSSPSSGRGERQGTKDVVLSDEQVSLLRRLAEAVSEPWPDAPADRPETRRTTDVVLTVHELAFLSRLAGSRASQQQPGLPPPRLAARLANVEADITTAAVGLVAIAVTLDEARWLDDQTRDVYGYITTEERRARLVLREKIHRALEELQAGSTRVSH